MPHSVSPLLLTLGDPNGIGPELVCRLYSMGSLSRRDRALVLIGPEQALIAHCQDLGLEPFWQLAGNGDLIRRSGIFLMQPSELAQWEANPGQANQQGGLAAALSLEAACFLLNAGQARGVVTCPLNKAMLQEAGFAFPGHTEFLAVKSGLGANDVCMLLAGDRLRVGLVTTHPRLKDVPDLVTREKIERCLLQMFGFVQAAGYGHRPVAVCGLNPHAGEQGYIGDEEEKVIIPAIEAVKKKGVAVSGPWPADSVFYRAYHGEFSAVLAMYHDQGLGPLKLVHFQQAVNVTLGLPFVRTSVDHGTAYDLVGTGQARTQSLKRALDLAERLMEGK
ncbi:MAG: 4-hydroxythreonine-4-phosphate dehydrogenase PdxA [Desulfovermiculus sp.]